MAPCDQESNDSMCYSNSQGNNTHMQVSSHCLFLENSDLERCFRPEEDRNKFRRITATTNTTYVSSRFLSTNTLFISPVFDRLDDLKRIYTEINITIGRNTVYPHSIVPQPTTNSPTTPTMSFAPPNIQQFSLFFPPPKNTMALSFPRSPAQNHDLLLPTRPLHHPRHQQSNNLSHPTIPRTRH